MHRGACIASKLGSYRLCAGEPGLPAMSDDAVGLIHRGVCIASKLGSYRSCAVLVGAGLARDER
jgi:hypothetical protein